MIYRKLIITFKHEILYSNLNWLHSTEHSARDNINQTKTGNSAWREGSAMPSISYRLCISWVCTTVFCVSKAVIIYDPNPSLQQQDNSRLEQVRGQSLYSPVFNAHLNLSCNGLTAGERSTPPLCSVHWSPNTLQQWHASRWDVSPSTQQCSLIN